MQIYFIFKVMEIFKMKKFLSLLLTLTLIFALVACNKDKNTSSIVNTTQSEEEITQTTENGNTTEDSSVETSSEQSNSIVSSNQQLTSNNTTSNNTAPNNTTSNNNVNNSNPNTIKKFNPKVIASNCVHKYQSPTCTSLIPCTICGELLTGLYQNQKIEYGHSYINNKCSVCGFENKGTLELNGSFFAINQKITVDINLMTNEQEIEIYPCVALYKYVNGSWKPYNGLYDVNEFFALEATHGEVLISNGIKYGRWDYMNNGILKTNPNAIVEKNFTQSRLIRRFKLLIPETGEYKIEITDGPNNSKKVQGKDYQYIIKTY